LNHLLAETMTEEGRIILSVLGALTVCALLAVVAIWFVRSATRAMVESHQAQDTEAQ